MTTATCSSTLKGIILAYLSQIHTFFLIFKTQSQIRDFYEIIGYTKNRATLNRQSEQVAINNHLYNSAHLLQNTFGERNHYFLLCVRKARTVPNSIRIVI